MFILVHVNIIQQLFLKYKLFLNNIIQTFKLENMFKKYMGFSNNLQKCTFLKHFTWPKSEYLGKKVSSYVHST